MSCLFQKITAAGARKLQARLLAGAPSRSKKNWDDYVAGGTGTISCTKDDPI